MNLISFDVGIKNMAYCIFSISKETGLIIKDWNVLNLIEDNNNNHHKCSCFNIEKTKKKRTNEKEKETEKKKECNLNAKYKKNDVFYCEKHALKCSQYIIPKKEYTMKNLNKMKIEELRILGKSLFLFNDIDNPSTEKMLKKCYLKMINDYFQKKCFETIVHKKKKSANDVDLIEIGKKMKELLNNVLEIENITHVIIENQISPIANRMKTIQGMLAQYFIMKNSDTKIEFISSSNKLKQFYKKTNDENLNENSKNELIIEEKKVFSKINNYKSHKKDAILFCSQILDKNCELHHWKTSLETKKKDDLCDCFLQGFWYLQNRNIILNADDLKINIV